ncbi:MAG: hypothetical protein ACOYXN_02455 [Acidobacteriota bacterium]
MRISFLSACVLLAIAGALFADQRTPPPGVKFEVVSVRVLSAKEAADRSPDFIGPNVAVRLRLSCAERGLYLYTWGDVVPVGYRVKWTERGVLWPHGMKGDDERPVSPGIKKLDALVPGKWLLLSGHNRPAIEWEELDSTSYHGEKHGFTIFIKDREKDEPTEIMTEPYVVPSDSP